MRGSSGCETPGHYVLEDAGGDARARIRDFLKAAPTPMKFEHFALNVPDARASVQWYMNHLGLTGRAVEAATRPTRRSWPTTPAA